MSMYWLKFGYEEMKMNSWDTDHFIGLSRKLNLVCDFKNWKVNRERIKKKSPKPILLFWAFLLEKQIIAILLTSILHQIPTKILELH